jgi:hypothetical protein
VTDGEPTDERVPTDELARLRRIEEAARHVLDESDRPRRSASSLLAAMAALRAALKETR